MNRKKQYALPSFADLPKGDDELTEEMFLADPYPYLQLSPRSARPSRDTSVTYRSHLNQFLSWCKELDCSPFALTRPQLAYFRDWLLHCGLKPSTVAMKLTVIRQFYAAAQSYRFTKTNPAIHLAVRATFSPPTTIKSLTSEEVSYLFSLLTQDDSLRTLRDRLILSFLVLEGVRVSEIHDMNEEAIDFTFRAIRIGKETIYPRDDTFTLLRSYLNACEEVRRLDASGNTPLFIVLGNHNRGGRMSRQAIRDAMNTVLKKADLYAQGVTCHTLRHTCGTLLLAATGNLDLVQQTMRHKDRQLLATYQTASPPDTIRHTAQIPIDPTLHTKKDSR